MKRAVYKIWKDWKPFSSPRDHELHEHFKGNPDHDGNERITDVTDPELFFFPASGKAPHPAVLVCPGGGYGHLAWTHEGLDTASLLNLNGLSAFVLKYRCPKQRQAAHADAVRAMRFIRAHAEQFEVLSERLGVIGFSAGAHLAATISAPIDSVPYPCSDEIDQFSFRPDFTVMIYPAYLSDEKMNISPEFHIDSNVPPTLLIQTEDDPIPVENSLGWYCALKKNAVPVEMHLYAEGGHGYALMRTGNPVSNWGELAGNWLRRQAKLL